MSDCMICDLYAVIDQHGDTSSDFVADLVTTLPPRGHAFHKLAIRERTYATPAVISTRMEQAMSGPGQPNAAVLKLAFWEALKRCGDDDRIHAMDYPYHNDPTIDGRLPKELWEHMAAAIQELPAAAGITESKQTMTDEPWQPAYIFQHPDGYEMRMWIRDRARQYQIYRVGEAGDLTRIASGSCGANEPMPEVLQALGFTHWLEYGQDCEDTTHRPWLPRVWLAPLAAEV